jgi:hypothetical protein
LVGNKSCIVVQRYDRIISPDGAVARVHQEDFCQALGFPPERKYQQEGGPLLRDCIMLLREWSTVAALDIRDFLDGVIFNVLIGNADAHGKNYSIRANPSRRSRPRTGRRWRGKRAWAGPCCVNESPTSVARPSRDCGRQKFEARRTMPVQLTVWPASSKNGQLHCFAV